MLWVNYAKILKKGEGQAVVLLTWSSDNVWGYTYENKKKKEKYTFILLLL